MVRRIKQGTFLIHESALLPDTLRIDRAECSNGWCSVTQLDTDELNRKIREAGWTFFYLAGEVRASVFGFDVETATRRALKRILLEQESDKFNCLEITLVARKRFLGFYFVSVSAHWRHIQESIFLSRHQRLAAWERASLTPVVNSSLASVHP